MEIMLPMAPASNSLGTSFASKSKNPRQVMDLYWSLVPSSLSGKKTWIWRSVTLMPTPMFHKEFWKRLTFCSFCISSKPYLVHLWKRVPTSSKHENKNNNNKKEMAHSPWFQNKISEFQRNLVIFPRIYCDSSYHYLLKFWKGNQNTP